MKTLTKNLVNGLLGLAVFAGAGAAWGQLSLLPVRTSEGCIFFHPFTSSIKEVTLAKMAERVACKNGKLDGAVFYGSAYTAAADGNAAERGFISMRAGIMVEGQFDGLYAVINQGGVLVLIAAAKPGQSALSQRFERESPQYSLQVVLDAIAEMTPRAGGRNANTNREYLQTIVRLWDANPYGMMKEFTDPPYVVTVTNPGWAGLATNSRSAGNTAVTKDDPKVFGRSARGG